MEALYYETPPLNMIRGNCRQSWNSTENKVCDDDNIGDGMDGCSIGSNSVDRVAFEYEMPIFKKEIHFANV